MKIVQLHAENFKRLGLVEITPDGHLVTVGGKNGHGKSSVLDAIYVALKGRAVAPPQPIRKGEEKAVIRLDMGELTVTRVFHEQSDGKPYTASIKVEDGEGRRYGEPQKVLDALLGDIGFDPIEFVKLKPKDQAARLLEMVPLTVDLDEMRAADESDFLNRRDVNRDIARLKAQVEGIPKEEVPVDGLDREALTDQLGKAADTNARINDERVRRERAVDDIARMRRTATADRDKAAEIRAEIERLTALARSKDQDADDMEAQADAAAKVLEGLDPLPEFVDTDVIRDQIRAADAGRAIAERQAERERLLRELEAAEKKAKAYTDAMAERAKERNAALAEAEMPVPGLSFALDDKGDPVLMFEGLPFDKDQISTAAQLRISTAIGMAANPTLRVLRIMDGSLLDEDSMRMLAEMAEAEDFQLWVEVVGDGGVGIVMENGSVRGAAEPEGDQAEAAQAEPPKPKGKAKPKAAPPEAPEGSLL